MALRQRHAVREPAPIDRRVIPEEEQAAEGPLTNPVHEVGSGVEEPRDRGAQHHIVYRKHASDDVGEVVIRVAEWVASTRQLRRKGRDGEAHVAALLERQPQPVERPRVTASRQVPRGQVAHEEGPKPIVRTLERECEKPLGCGRVRRLAREGVEERLGVFGGETCSWKWRGVVVEERHQ